MGGGWTTKVVLEKGGGGGSGRAVVGVGLQASLGVRWGEGGKGVYKVCRDRWLWV